MRGTLLIDVESVSVDDSVTHVASSRQIEPGIGEMAELEGVHIETTGASEAPFDSSADVIEGADFVDTDQIGSIRTAHSDYGR